jgi:pectate lyase
MKSRMMMVFAAVLQGFVMTSMGAPNFSMIGYATTNGATTGGAGGTTRTITSLSALVSWAASREKNTASEMVTISGTISGDTLITIKNGANITIQGTGSSSQLVGVGLNIRDYTNVIVKNLKIREVLYPNDALTLDNVQRGWVDHCELHSKIGAGIGQDTYDGLLDIKKGSAAITISWCYLHDHMKCSLVGHTDNLNQQAEDSKIRVTYHHNYFVNTDGRNPSIRYGATHMFNNYYGTITDYGLASRDGAHAKVENCHYENVKLPMSTDKFMDPTSDAGDKIGGYICQSGNLFTGSCGDNVISQTGCDWWNSSTLPYSYTLDDVNSVKAIVQRYAGFGSNPSVEVIVQREARATVAPVRTTICITTGSVLQRAGSGAADVYDINGKKLSPLGMQGKRLVQGVYIVRSRSPQ